MRRHKQLPDWVALLYLTAVLLAGGYVLYLAVSALMGKHK